MPPSSSSVSANRSSVAATRCVGGIGSPFDLGDDAGEDRVERAAQLDGHAGAQLLQAVGLGEDLVVGRDARGEVGLQARGR